MRTQISKTLPCLAFMLIFVVACSAAPNTAASVDSTSSPPAEVASPVAARPTPDIRPYLQMDLSGGDAQQGINVAIAYECQACHNGTRPERGPRFTVTGDLPYVLERGEARLADPAYEGQATTNMEYLLEAIFIPQAHVAPGEWALEMPDDYAERIEEEDLAHLLAWMETFNESTAEPAAEEPPTAPTEKESAIDLEMELPAGDALVGELTALSYRCTGCHDNGAFPDVNGPEFSASAGRPPILERAEQRIADAAYAGGATSGQEYLVESILNPAAYLLPGDWVEVMPDTFHEDLTAQDLADLLAWMASFGEPAVPPTTAPGAETANEKAS